MPTYRRLQIQLPRKDEKALGQLLLGGIQQVRVLVRALALLQLAWGQSPPQVARNLGRTAKRFGRFGQRYEQEGLEPSLVREAQCGSDAFAGSL